MATLADLVRKQRESGSSRTGALFTAVGQKTLAAIDPRKMFNQKGLLTAMFPSLRAYKPDSSRSKVDAASAELSGSTTPLLEQMVMKLDGLDLTMRLVAKNTMAMPGMSRDMNIMRQNVVKLVKLQGGQASTRADSFFLRAFERERATEAELQAAKERRATGRASAVTTVKEKASSIPGLGMLMGLVGAITTFGSSLIGAVKSLSDVLGPLAKGGLSLIFDIAGSFAKLAVKGGGTLLALTGKGLASLLMRIAPFLLNPAVIGLLSAGAIAWLLGKMYTSDSTQTNVGTEGYTPEDTQTPPPTTGKGLAQLKDEQDRAERGLRAGRAADPDGSYANAEMRRFQRQGASSGPSTSPTPVPNKSVTSGSDGELLDFIAAKESGGDYNAVYGKGSVPGLTDMTIAQVLDYQRQLLAQGQKSSAVGRYQFIRSTLAEEASAAGIDINKEKFTPENQDKLILNRLKRIRGLDKFKSGQLSPQQFAENLSMEFASLPSPIRGGGTKSYYEGIAGNKALTSMENVYAAISPKTTSTQLASASSAVSDARQEMSSQPTVVNAPTNNNIQNNSNGQGGSTGKPASAYDRELSQALLGLIT